MYQLGHLLLPVGTVSLLDAVRNELKELSPLRERQEQLASQEDKINMAERRLEAIVHSHKKATEESEVRVKKKREEEQFAISQQMKLEEQEAARIEAVKQVRTMVDSGQRMVLFTFLGRER